MAFCEYVITEYRDRPFLCVINDGRISELDFDEDTDMRIGNIYIAKVIDIVRNISSAFLDLGGGVKGYLQLDESLSGLHQQDEIMVQIRKAAMKTKDIAVSDDISISGEYVALSLKKHILGISKKIENEDRRIKLKGLFADEDMSAFGIVVRTNAAEAADAEIMSEYGKLKEQFLDILSKSKTRTCFSCLYEAPDMITSMVRDQKSGHPDKILTDIKDIYDRLSVFTEVTFYSDTQVRLIKLLSIESCIEGALKSRVWLKSGGYLVIEYTEAMTVIDVNSGKNTEKKNNETIYLKTNLEAADEIARQLRLRNISGMVMIDFINMRSDNNVRELLRRLRESLSSDPVQSSLIDMTKLGIVEVTRMKIRKPIYEILR